MKLIAICLLCFTLYLVGWNIGFDIGHQMGVNESILKGILHIHICKAKEECQ